MVLVELGRFASGQRVFVLEISAAGHAANAYYR